MATLRNMAKNSVHVITYSNSMEPIIPDRTTAVIDCGDKIQRWESLLTKPWWPIEHKTTL